MEDVLKVYERPNDVQQPVICLDEKRKASHPACRRAATLADRDGKHDGITNTSVAGPPLFSVPQNPRQAPISPSPRPIVRVLSSLK